MNGCTQVPVALDVTAVSPSVCQFFILFLAVQSSSPRVLTLRFILFISFKCHNSIICRCRLRRGAFRGCTLPKSQFERPASARRPSPLLFFNCAIGWQTLFFDCRSNLKANFLFFFFQFLHLSLCSALNPVADGAQPRGLQPSTVHSRTRC